MTSMPPHSKGSRTSPSASGNFLKTSFQKTGGGQGFIRLMKPIRINIQILSNVFDRTVPLVHQPNRPVLELPIIIPVVLTRTDDPPPALPSIPLIFWCVH